MKTEKQMALALQMVSGYGGEFSAWRMPGTDPAAYTNTDSYVERAKLAEKGKFQMIFIADTPVLNNDLGPQTPSFPYGSYVGLNGCSQGNRTNRACCHPSPRRLIIPITLPVSSRHWM